MHIIGCVLTLGAIVGLNSIIIMNANCEQKQNCNSSNNISFNSQQSQLDININILFISIGVICIILYVSFFICIECAFKTNFNSSTNSRQIYPLSSTSATN